MMVVRVMRVIAAVMLVIVAVMLVIVMAVIVLAACIARTGPVTASAGMAVLLAAIFSGVLDASANVCYLLATRAGLFGLAVVLTSLYPGVTVLLARVVHGERMGRVQQAGLALAAAGVLMVTL